MAKGTNSVALGENTEANAINTFVFGNGTKVNKPGSFSFGLNNTIDALRTFVLGENSKINEAAIESFILGNNSEIAPSAYRSYALGWNNSIAQFNTVVFGTSNIAKGAISAVIGHGNKTDRDSYTMGFKNVAGPYSSVIGFENVTHATDSHIVGSRNESLNTATLIFGYRSIAGNIGETVVGFGNAITTKEEAGGLHPKSSVFQVGIGETVIGGYRRNGITILRDGFTGIGIDGVEEAAKPTQMLDIGKGNVRVRDLSKTAGQKTDKLVVADPDGVLKTIDASSLTPTLPVAKALSTDGIILIKEGTETTAKNNVVESVLKDMTLSIADKSIGAEKLKPGANEGDVLKVVKEEGLPDAVKWAKDLNIYEADGILKGDRTVDFGSHDLLTYQKSGTDFTQKAEFNLSNVHSALGLYGKDGALMYLHGGTSKLIVSQSSDAAEINTDAPQGLRFVTEDVKDFQFKTYEYPSDGTESIEHSNLTIKGNGALQVHKINSFIGTSTDKMVVADDQGVLKTVRHNAPKLVDQGNGNYVFYNEDAYNADGTTNESKGIKLVIPKFTGYVLTEFYTKEDGANASAKYNYNELTATLSGDISYPSAAAQMKPIYQLQFKMNPGGSNKGKYIQLNGSIHTVLATKNNRVPVVSTWFNVEYEIYVNSTKVLGDVVMFPLAAGGGNSYTHVLSKSLKLDNVPVAADGKYILTIAPKNIGSIVHKNYNTGAGGTKLDGNFVDTETMKVDLRDLSFQLFEK
ncbi:hypothetical protein [Myroides sp.]|uniref:hypothetical protein n=1 Tax=Myroides sp. TaxID=1874736 RepID=UPI003F3A71A1